MIVAVDVCCTQRRSDFRCRYVVLWRRQLQRGRFSSENRRIATQNRNLGGAALDRSTSFLVPHTAHA